MRDPQDGPTEAEENAMDRDHFVTRLDAAGMEHIATAPRDGTEIAMYLDDEEVTRKVVFFAHGLWWDANGGVDVFLYWQRWDSARAGILGWLPAGKRIGGAIPPAPREPTPAETDDIAF